MSYPVQPPPPAAPAPAPPSGPPTTVTAASALLWVMATAGLIYAGVTLAVVPGVVHRFRSGTAGGNDMDTYVSVIWLGAAVALAVAVILFALYVVLGVALRRGSNGARIATLVISILGLLGGAVAAITVGLERSGDDPAGSLGERLHTAYPTGWISTNVGLALAQVLAYAIVLLLILRAPRAFFLGAPATPPGTPMPAVYGGTYPPGFAPPTSSRPGFGAVAPGQPGYPAPGHPGYPPSAAGQPGYSPSGQPGYQAPAWGPPGYPVPGADQSGFSAPAPGRPGYAASGPGQGGYPAPGPSGFAGAPGQPDNPWAAPSPGDNPWAAPPQPGPAAPGPVESAGQPAIDTYPGQPGYPGGDAGTPSAYAAPGSHSVPADHRPPDASSSVSGASRSEAGTAQNATGATTTPDEPSAPRGASEISAPQATPGENNGRDQGRQEPKDGIQAPRESDSGDGNEPPTAPR